MARKILLADDSVTAQNMGRKILADAGYEVITVNNGSAALKKIAEQKPDLIVLDVYMPGYSGLEVCQRLKEAQETSRVPVLLTVGKLEPFKPEEAKRARADGFIVKPFEASELLSALSKLEDKIVPRPEPSKPGRFARATAAIEEGRYDKSVAIDEDSGWKNRIGFPHKKKEKAAQEDGDDSEIYNSMNKDLRTTVERKPAEKPHPAKAEETRVDLGALAPEGLPKDVTPEEIAALAAAAAQVQAKIEESRHGETGLTESGLTESRPAAVQTEHHAQTMEPAKLAGEIPQEAAPLPVATFAEQKSEEKIEAKSEKSEEKSAAQSEERPDAPAEKSVEAPKEAASVAAPSTADVIAALAGLELDSVTSPGATSSNGSWSNGTPDRVADEPVTMAMAAGAASGGASSRWTAVSVALAPEEAAISLEQEMQKAYAAFAAAEAGHAGFDTAPPEIQPAVAESAAAEAAGKETSSSFQSSPDAAVSEPVVAVPAAPAPEAAQSLSAVASAATEAVSAAVKELEAVAASFLEPTTQTTETSPAPVEPEPAPVEKAEAAVPLAPEVPQSVEASSEARVEAKTDTEERPVAADPETAKLETASPDAPETRHEEQKDEESKSAAPTPDVIAQAAPEESSVTAGTKPEITAPEFANEAPANQVAEIAASAAGEAAPAGRGEAKDDEIAANTAAAWASWRRIRESGTHQSSSSEHSAKEAEERTSGSKPEAEAEAARAVAAGAEKTPEEASAAPESDSEGIADIVDSVLADLRPKIYEEISRKMHKKK